MNTLHLFGCSYRARVLCRIVKRQKTQSQTSTQTVQLCSQRGDVQAASPATHQSMPYQKFTCSWLQMIIQLVLPIFTQALMKGAGSTSGAACEDLVAMNTTWWYDWTPDRHGGVCNSTSGFVPMIWGTDDIAKLARVDRTADALLGFNEPDNCNGQSCISVDEAVSLWPKLRATGMRLGSPAVTTGGGDWLGNFLYRVGCGPKATPPCQVDFLALHYYGACDAQSFYDFLEAWRRPYPDLPLWVTEFSCPSFSSPGTVKANLEFMQTALPRLASAAPTLERYAWFATRTYANKGSTTGYENTTLYKDCGVGCQGEEALTELGRAYARITP